TWRLPIIGINTTTISGISTLTPGQEITLEGTYLVEAPIRYMGAFIEPRFFDQYDEGNVVIAYPFIGFVMTYDVNQLQFNILPRADRRFGPLVLAWRDATEVLLNGHRYLEETVHMKNIGTTTAYNVDPQDFLPPASENFTVKSGSTNPSSFALLPPEMEYTFTYIVQLPDGSSTTLPISYLMVYYDVSTGYQWYDQEILSSIETHDAAVPIPGIQPSVVWTLAILLAGVAAFAIIVLLLLLQEKGKIKLPKLKLSRRI
nr:hypothetical protein [Candidatus Sigynarchaeota archaeon]